MFRHVILLGLALGLGAPAVAGSEARLVTVGQTKIAIERVVGGLDEPWGLAFLPDGGFLVTERDGRLTQFSGDPSRTPIRIEGLPEVAAEGQGGLLDVLVPKNFDRTREVLFSYSKPQPDGAGTALASGRLSKDGGMLEGVRVLFEMAPGSSGGRHFGSRIVEARDGTIFLTIGDRGEGVTAQDPMRHEGSVVHLTREGLPASPGLFGDAGLPELYSKGHRNAQGAALDREGRLWVVEHGARGGDELNLVEPGENYGWPLISFGTDYDGSAIGVGTEAPGLTQPMRFWDPSIAPSGLMIYSGAMFPDWAGHVFTGSLKYDYIAIIDKGGLGVESRIEGPETGRVRDIREAPDGSIWFLSVTDGAVYRIFRS
jgi:glucose/arabinose dehydrogenase